MFDFVTVALRRPGPEGEARRALLGAMVTQRSLAVVRPEKIRHHDLKWSRCGVGRRGEDEQVSMGPEGLVVVYIAFDTLLQMDEAIYCVVLYKFACE